MSHELFHDVTDRRPAAGRAASGTLVVSIVAHALILAAVVVVPLLATDLLPTPPSTAIGPFAVPVVPPSPAVVAAAVTRTPSLAPTPRLNVAPVAPPDSIEPEREQAGDAMCVGCVVAPTARDGVPDSIGEGGEFTVAPPPPPPVVPEAPVRVGVVRMPTKVHDVAPQYPTIARNANLEGDVIIEAVIAVDGSVRDARVLRSAPLLDHAALDAVRQWRYAPTRLNGVPVPVIVTVTVRFRLQR